MKTFKNNLNQTITYRQLSEKEFEYTTDGIKYKMSFGSNWKDIIYFMKQNGYKL